MRRACQPHAFCQRQTRRPGEFIRKGAAAGLHPRGTAAADFCRSFRRQAAMIPVAGRRWCRRTFCQKFFC